MEQLKVIYLPLSELTMDEDNAKEHPQWQIEEIKQSIRDFRMCDPIGIAGDNNLVLAGHGRVMALEQLGAKEVPCIRLDHLDSRERQRAYALVHNKTTMDTAFNVELLDINLAEIETIDMGLYGFGKTEEEDNDIVVNENPTEGFNVTIVCKDLSEAEALSKLIHVDFDFTRQKLKCNYSDISV